MASKYVVKLTMEDALVAGLVRCANCGYPPNNHWENAKPVKPRPGESACAHTHCPIFKPYFIRGRAIKKKRA